MNGVRKFLQRRRKGAILATCFVAMTVVMLLSSTILLFVQWESRAVTSQQLQFEQRRTLSELGDKFVAGTLSDEDLPEGWSAEQTGTELVLKKGETVLLTVRVSEGEQREVLLWKTGAVSSTEEEGEE